MRETTRAWSNRFAEGLILTMACASPWMFGAVDAWAQYILEIGIGIVAILSAIFGPGAFQRRGLLQWTNLGLAGLVILGMTQAIPLPAKLRAVVDPSGAALHSRLIPAVPERVLGDNAPPVALSSATLSEEPGALRDTAARLLAAWLLFQSVLNLGGGIASLRRFAWVIAVNATLLALFALIQALTWNGKLYWYFPISKDNGWSAGGPFVSHSHLAEYLNLGFGLALGILLGGGKGSRPGHRSNRIWAAYLVGVLLLGIVTSQSRRGFVSMLVAVGLTGLVLRIPRAKLWVGIGAVIVSLAVFLVALGDAAYVARLRTIVNPGDTSYALRIEIWRDVSRAFRLHPIFGTGLGTFPSAAAPYLHRDHGEDYMHAEDEYVEMLVEGGLVGLGLAASASSGSRRASSRGLANASNATDRNLILGASAGGLAVLFQCLVDFGLHIPGVAIPMVVASAHLCQIGMVADGKRVVGNATGWLGRVLAMS